MYIVYIDIIGYVQVRPGTCPGTGVCACTAPGSAHMLCTFQLPNSSPPRCHLAEFEISGWWVELFFWGKNFKSCLHDPCSAASRISMLVAHMQVRPNINVHACIHTRILAMSAAVPARNVCRLSCAYALYLLVCIHTHVLATAAVFLLYLLEHVCRACKSAHEHGNRLFGLAAVSYQCIRPAATSSQPAVKRAGLRIGVVNRAGSLQNGSARFKTGGPF